jgi:hypothetical protein
VALAPEISRAKVTVRKRIAGLISERKDQLVEFMPGSTATERERNFLVIFSAMTGAVCWLDMPLEDILVMHRAPVLNALNHQGIEIIRLDC